MYVLLYDRFANVYTNIHTSVCMDVSKRHEIGLLLGVVFYFAWNDSAT